MKSLARQQDKAEVLQRLRRLRPESTHRWGRMSAHQMLCHLADGFRMAAGRKPVIMIGGPFARTALKWIVLYIPLRWPPGIRTCPEIDQECGGTKPTDFATDIVNVEKLLELVTTEAQDFNLPHPLFGTMSRAAWLRWGYLHMDHHLRQFGA